MRESARTGRLVSFKLADVPLTLRLAAIGVAGRQRDDEQRPEDRLFGRLLADAAASDVDLLRAAALAPSDRTYWIGEAAWQAVIGKVRT